ncbi:sulfatase [Halomicrobium urmianum]|uniref:sulfatase n=1 Tax=Halomicrobium urmianum TaxID=1586233 RepID=UPI001CD94832|nr:sulfatase [Halomicrobium urmianum]
MTAPNILFLVLDAVRVDHASTYGYERETTPTMSELADDGVRYDHAFAPSIWTPTVHGAVFTGRYPSHTGIYGNSLGIPDDDETLPETLQRQGYRTFAASAGAHIRAGRGYDRGIDEFVETRRISPDVDFFRKVLTDRSFARQVLFSLTRGPDDKTQYKYDRLERFVDRSIDDGEPFFGFINAKTAHNPFNPPRPYKEMFCDGFDRPRWEFLERLRGQLGGETQRLRDHDTEKLRQISSSGGDGVMVDAVEMTEEEWDVIRAWYDGAIRYLDDVVGRLVAHLKERGVYEDTLIVMTADHGDNFGDHGLARHAFCLYDTLLHVPLVIKPPATGDAASVAGRTIDEQVSLVDLHPTFLDAAGASMPEYDFAESLLNFEQRRYHDFTFAEYAGFEGSIQRLQRKYPDFDPTQFARTIQSVRDDKHKLIVDNDGNRELYAWRADPGETEDLADQRPEVVDALEAELEGSLNPLDSPGDFATPDDPELEEQLRDLGYI